MSIGQLANPELARFAIMTPLLFVPPNPLKSVGAEQTCPVLPTFSDFFEAYFGGASIDMSAPQSGSMLENMKRCYENHKANPVDACQYYINGFRRVATNL